MQAANRLQKALKKGVTSFGGWQMLPGTNLARAMAGTGLDWICVDCEHGNIADADMHEAVTAIAATSVSPIVRIPANEPWMVKRALDTGSHGIICPLIQTADEVRRLVSSAKFPPRGTRGFGSPFSHGAFGVKTQVDYLQQANNALVTIVQIETREALENVDAIAAVDGVDVLFVGPFDLGNNLNHPIVAGDMDEELKTAIDSIHAAAKNAGKSSGIYCTSGQQARDYSDKGFDMISVSGDMAAIGTHIAQELGVAKGSLAHEAYKAAKNVASKVTGPSS